MTLSIRIRRCHGFYISSHGALEALTQEFPENFKTVDFGAFNRFQELMIECIIIGRGGYTR